MSLLSDLRPIEFRQVCAIARVVLLRDATMTNFEWKEAVKDTCAKQRYFAPELDMLDRALRAVEYSLLQTMGPRPIKNFAPVASPPPPEKPPLTPAEWAAFAETVRQVQARTVAALPANVRTIAKETLEVGEHAALDQFYIEAEGDRIAALRRFAELAIARDAGWDPSAVRATSHRHGLRAFACFACRKDSREIEWHHVIQIQHGGSNMPRNRVALCGACHADVHPWLPPVARVAKNGWTGVVDLIVPVLAAWERNLPKRNETA